MVLRRNYSKRLALRARGFTLTEVAIVLGISGVVLAGVWAAASNVNNTNNAQVTQTILLNSLASYRAMYGANTISAADASATGASNIICIGVNAGFYPKNTIRKSPCTDADWSTLPMVESKGVLWAFLDSGNQGIGIGAQQISKTLCTQLAAQLTQYPDAIWYSINGSSAAGFGAITLSASAAAALCTAADGANSIFVTFKK